MMGKQWRICHLSRSQNPQASWSADGRWERLWGNGKNLIFLIGCSLAVHCNKPENRYRQDSCGNNSITQETTRCRSMTKKPEDSQVRDWFAIWFTLPHLQFADGHKIITGENLHMNWVYRRLTVYWDIKGHTKCKRPANFVCCFVIMGESRRRKHSQQIMSEIPRSTYSSEIK